MKRAMKKELERITVDRKIIEGLIQGYSLTHLAKSIGKGKNYVIKIRDLGIERGYIVSSSNPDKLNKFVAGHLPIPPYPEALFQAHDGRSQRGSETERLLEGKREWIKERLELGWSRQTIFEELSVAVPRANFYRYVDKQKMVTQSMSRNVMELIHGPGECLQVDWGKLFDVYDPETGKKKTIWIFIGVLGHSRFEVARVVERLDYRATIEALMSMFEELGGVPARVTTDNPKVFVKEASMHEPIHNPAFERFASHYGFVIEALPPASPEKKGKVERMVPVKRRLFESYDISKYSSASAQAHLDRKLEITNERKHGTHGLRPIDVFINDEAAKLKSLPLIRYEIEEITYQRVRADGYVRVDSKYYRIDSRLKGQDALVISSSSTVSIYMKGRLLEVYERVTERFQTKACKDHYKESWERTLEDHGHYLRRAAEIGPDVERFVACVLARGDGFVDNKVVWGLLTLDKKYERVDINRVCVSALELSQVNLKTVRQLLTIMARPKNQQPNTLNAVKATAPYEAQMKGGKFARPMSEYKKHLSLVREPSHKQ